MTTYNETYRAVPPWSGLGYIGGTAPDGLVTFNGTGTVRDIALFDRATGYIVATTTSASDGTYRFDGLSLNRVFDVIARGSSDTENDIIAARVTAAISPLVVTGSFLATSSVSQAYSSSLSIDGGVPPYSNPLVASGSLPLGASLSIVRDSVILSGVMPSAPATYDFTVSVESSDGQTATSSAQEITLTDKYSFWRLNIASVNGDNNGSVTELVMRDTSGGPNLCVGGSAFSSSDFSSTFAAAFAFDGSISSRWAAQGAFGFPQIIGYHFTSSVAVVEITITAGNHDNPGVPATNAPVVFSLEKSNDGSTWHTAGSWTTSPATWSYHETRTFTV
jgi:hypothetical protein